jgi:glucose-6-phosphate 1-dehydrogenase
MQHEPHVFVILGATGDLAKRKLFPALYRLTRAQGHGPQIVAVGGDRELNSAEFRQVVRQALFDTGAEAEELKSWLETSLHYCALGDGGAEEYQRLAGRLHALEADHDLHGNRVFYLALPPASFPATIEQLGAAHLNRNRGWSRLVIEKPFGNDLMSARALNTLIHRYFEEAQVYRIDHYLGKETVQNLLALRFANALFESVWNRDRIERVEVTVAEALGVESRAGYYDQAGALRDMVQNHLTQLLTLITVEAPAAFDPDAIRYEKVKVLTSMKPPRQQDAVFGQYLSGMIDGTEVPATARAANATVAAGD